MGFRDGHGDRHFLDFKPVRRGDHKAGLIEEVIVAIQLAVAVDRRGDIVDWLGGRG